MAWGGAQSIQRIRAGKANAQNWQMEAHKIVEARCIILNFHSHQHHKYCEHMRDIPNHPDRALHANGPRGASFHSNHWTLHFHFDWFHLPLLLSDTRKMGSQTLRTTLRIFLVDVQGPELFGGGVSVHQPTSLIQLHHYRSCSHYILQLVPNARASSICQASSVPCERFFLGQ